MPPVLERNLNLVLQILEITDRVVICLNLMDEATRNGFQINERTLAKELGVPVIPSAARQGEGMNELLKMIFDVAAGNFVCKPHRIKSSSNELIAAVERLSNEIKLEFPDLPNARWVALRLLEGDQSIIEAIRSGELGNLKKNESLVEAN